ncbi:alpha/beta hydrolase [Candidatus Bathyarchaeota archaeon]|nr:alpha/beta hydrolase [Candidatus Bathyarchaeota archaeon]
MKCKLDGCTVHYEIRGEGRPFIMLHGGGPDRRSMIGCLEPILKKRKGWQRIYPDLPGMGRTPAEEWITNSDQMLEIVLDFINEVIPNQHFILAGDSYGGYLALGVICRMPKKVDGLLLICPVVTASHAERTLPKHVTLVKSDSLPSDLYPQETQMFKSFAVVQTQKIFERTRKEILSGLKIADMKFLDRIESHGYPFTFNVDAPSIILEKPALILVGRQDSMVGYHDSWKILENYPRATLAVLDRAGHGLQIEQERLFNTLVDEWLNRVEETSACTRN